MEIEWFGGNHFTLRSDGTVLETEPASSGTSESDIVTISRPRTRTAERAQRPFVIDGPGEYEVKDIFVIGVATAIDTAAEDAETTGGGTIYAITVDGVTVCHAGDNVRVPTRADVDTLGPIDVLLVSSAAGGSSRGDKLSDLIGRLDPSIIVPMEPGESGGGLSTDRIAKLVGGAEGDTELRSLSVIAGQLPDDTQLVRLACRSAETA